MLKAIIFDIDGVLVDSREANIALYKSLTKSAGYNNIKRDDINNCFHLPLKESLEKLLNTNDQVEIQRILDMVKDPKHLKAYLFEFPNELETILEKLHKKYKLAIVTSRIRLGIDHIFDAKDIKHFFDVTVAYEDYNNPKPHPEPLLVAIKKLGVKVDEAVYVGDSNTDIESAKSAGMASIHLSEKVHKDAACGISRFGEVIEAVNRIN